MIRALTRAGWRQSRQTGGSHLKFTHPDRPGHVIVPIHGNRDLPPGTLKSILLQAGMSVETLKELI